MKLALVVACCMAAAVEGGGWLKSPLGRGSIWKIDSNYLYPDYDHMNTNCGGPLVSNSSLRSYTHSISQRFELG